MSSLMSNTNVSNLFFQRSKAAVVRTTITGRSSMASSGSCVRVHPGGICLNGTETGKRSMIGSDVGPRTVRSNLSYGTYKANSMPRVVSTGANSMWTARSSRQPEPPPADRMIVKRGPNQARTGHRTCPWLQPRRVLNQDPSANGSARPPAGSSPVGRSAPRVGLLHRLDERGIGPSVPRTASEAP